MRRRIFQPSVTANLALSNLALLAPCGATGAQERDGIAPDETIPFQDT